MGLSLLPEPPGWELDWAAIHAEFAWMRPMADCQQDPAWHMEGDVLLHTRMVCEALVAMDSWRELLPEERSVLFAAALLHDVGKPLVTQEKDGRIRSPRHAAKGAQAARTILWEDLLPAVSLENFHLREQIIALVHHHPLPLHFLNVADPRREAIAVSQVVRLDWLAMLAEADAAGRQRGEPRGAVGAGGAVPRAGPREPAATPSPAASPRRTRETSISTAASWTRTWKPTTTRGWRSS